ncbi:hypothetical protein AMBLS11_03050 [Alteromonas macleodii str. 'Black Sea 11']|jgi:hypothetical protein|uniref:Uncharacterized protein n=1 Tax=Alteromonas australica TaxID=589873 RepID=A0A358DU67_9ALTE|nr:MULTISPECIES: hypothetical protein [Alteromonas]AFT77200.1 hypothetical protein AMBLS11_03050 [Alteromonas macleodii str. 'Black Sea 11']NKW88408.1 hypothetical protein [Alteromonadaceae bacterium A_SAG4]NKX04014.1 hypothetical protein [Alteromonadaceae bacterium A_SAG6]NKX19988.1 hypothetical protein [Alteromonadaceae bacterium A_SAG8]NKX35900.1 hypothetical protein [Alteromonadaceae bacterium A_SAG3]HBU49821.1 hypothetical protein [Alteromonas australica]|tara:strand:- start:1649 stop:2020 length:372 start_codon:yes stop_codon:yes gene_type:complete
MLRFFIIAAEIIVLVIVLRSPFVQYLFEDIQNSVSEWLVSIATLPEREELSSLQDTINIQLSPLKPYQQAYVQQITADSASVKRFYHTYCEKDDINPNFTGTKRAQLCLIIKQSPVMQVARRD